LRKSLPLGLLTYGSGNIGSASIATLAKDFRAQITDEKSTHRIDPDTYTVEQVAQQFYDFIYTQHYVPESQLWPTKHLLGFIVAGYSAGLGYPEQWSIRIDSNGNCNGPVQVAAKDSCGALWNGITEPLARLFSGLSQDVEALLRSENVEETKIKNFLTQAGSQLTAPLITPLMPIQDAIEMARFMVHLTTEYVRFSPGHNIVGGPVEVATITKHEGFKWIERKRFYDMAIN